MAIKNRLKLILAERNDISQNILAEKLNISKSTMSNIINGKQNATLETAFELSEVLDMDIQEIFYKEVDFIEDFDEHLAYCLFDEMIRDMNKVSQLQQNDIIKKRHLRIIYQDMIDDFIRSLGVKLLMRAVNSFQDKLETMVDKVAYQLLKKYC